MGDWQERTRRGWRQYRGTPWYVQALGVAMALTLLSAPFRSDGDGQEVDAVGPTTTAADATTEPVAEHAGTSEPTTTVAVPTLPPTTAATLPPTTQPAPTVPPTSAAVRVPPTTAATVRATTTVPPPPPSEPPVETAAPATRCHPSYEGACLPPDASDVDCTGGSGNGPEYADGPFRVVGPDEYDLDGDDNDGIACES